jgi:hypothetical protein
MLPDARQIGEPQIDHLDLLVLDRLQDIFGCGTIRNHGFIPATMSGALQIPLPLSRGQAAWDGLQSKSSATTFAFRQIPLPASQRLQL